jgi:hypothetical protein
MVLSASMGHLTPIPLDAVQSRDLLLTLAQALLGAVLLLNMQLAWWEATGLFMLFVIQLADFGGSIRVYVTWVYFAWAALEMARLITSRRKPAALHHFHRILRQNR